jgi:hypothetical protein
MEQENKSAKIRNYAIAGFCIVLTVMAIGFFIVIFLSIGGSPVNIWSQCNNDTANVFINANKELKDVRCIALNKDLYKKSEISIGDLSKNDKDVCSFRLSDNATEPLRFEVYYNGEIRKEVCNAPQYADD